MSAPGFRWSQAVLAVLISLPFLYYFQAFPNYRNPNELSRLLLISAIVDDGSIQIDHALQRFGDCQDISYFDGHYYSNKAIGYSILGVPVYLLFRGAGQGQPDVLIYVLRIFLNLIPMLAFSVLFIRCLKEDLGLGSFAYVLCIAFLFGTLVFPYAQMFAGHMVTGLCWFAAFHFLTHRDLKTHGFVAGAFLGLSFLLEIPSLIIFPFFFAWALFHKRIMLVPFAVGAIVLSLPAFIYNYAAFGDPLTWAYQLVATPELKAVVQKGYVGLTVPSLDVLWKLAFGSNRGFFHFTPHLVFGVGGICVALLRSRRNWLIPAIVISNLLFYSAFASWDGGWSFGSRFLVPLVPLMVYASGQWFAYLDSSSNRYRISSVIYLLLVGVTIPMMVMGASTFLLSPRFLPLILFWEVPVLFWRGFFGLHWGELFGVPVICVQIFTIVAVLLPMMFLLRRARLSFHTSMLLISAVVATFAATAAFTPYIEARMPAAHCLAIGRIGYIQAQYPGALLFLNRAKERSGNSGVGQEAEAWIQAIEEKVKTRQ